MESHFNQLILTLQGQSSEMDEDTCSELVDMMMRSRKVGRPPRGQPLAGIYKEICDRIRHQLTQLLQDCIAKGLLQPDPTWGYQLRTQATQEALTDPLLKGLALEAQSQPHPSSLRQHALLQLVEAIRACGRLARPHRAKFTPSFYTLLYEEAVNRTLVYVCQKIDTYDPHRGQSQKFMNWVNFRLDRMVIECRRQFSDRNAQELPNLNDLERLSQPEPPSSLANDVRDYIANDPEDLFKSTHIRKRPDANFQTIALARFANQSWEEISTQLEIKIPTLSSFFQRCCDKFSDRFQELI
ncbi:hypothetical protein [Leptothoe sp. PORK10 BA2]|uniref:hypothetical protein n=1 Tax=Leptothoe sp. PORK10 BA2 TaxID=3110254 RepID=UPI002B1E9440|nr:hypothetical protein [Leptothoe sp. PORK10 BA2]MEA5463738.1 hypothetical protein [Leptothoe sp. PORK10 BA2]